MVRVRSQARPGVESTPLRPPSEPLTGDAHAHLLAPLRAFIESLGFTVSFEPIPGQTGGWCDPKARRIVVDADQPANARLRILFTRQSTRLESGTPSTGASRPR